MCLGLAMGYIEPKREYAELKQTYFPEKSGGSGESVDPDTNAMTPQEALSIVEGYEKALKEDQEFLNNGDEFHIEALKVCEVVKQALNMQIPKKLIENGIGG